MKNLEQGVFKNPFILGYLALYATLLVLLRSFEAFNIVEPMKSIAILVTKRIVFVLVPLVLFRGIWKYTLRDLVNISTGGGSIGALPYGCRWC